MIFTSVEIQNFLRFKQATVPLANQGLVLVQGVNHDSTAADSNGAGKSTIFEAIVWCLWGKTVRGYSTDKVINRTVGKDCWVRLKIEHEGEEYSVERYRKHHQYRNELHFTHYTPQGPADMSEGTPTMTQQLLIDWLGIDFDTYIRGPMVGQGHFKRFSQMTDAEQKAVLETALQVSVLSEARDVAKAKAAALQLQLQQGEFALGRAKEQRSYLKDKLEKCSDEYREEWRKYQGLMKGMYTHVVGAVCRAEHAEEQLEELPEVDVEAAETLLTRLEGLKENQEGIHDKAMDKLREHLARCLGDLQVAKGEAKSANAALAAFRSKVEIGQKCPTCLRVTTKEHRDDCMQELVGKISECEAAVILEQQEHDDAQQAVHDLIEKHSEQRTKTAGILSSAQKKLDAARVVADRQAYWVNDIEEAELVHEQELARFRAWADKSVPRDRSTELADELAELEKNIHRLGEDYMKIEEEHSYLEFWNKGFGNSGLKSLIFDSIVPFLNDRAKLYARDLTDGEVKIEFSTKTKLKSGELREKFQVLTDNVNGAEDYEGASGGEAARIDLAINFSMSDLMAARAKKSFPQRFFDEPFEGVDEAGLEAVMELLSQMTSQCGTIFVVTHKPALASLFNKVITVHKKDGVSTLEA